MIVRDEEGVHRKFDRVVKFDERSRAFPVRTLVPPRPRSYTWRCESWLDQGSEGACVGFAWAQELCARPAVMLVGNAYARNVYHQAQKIDEWPGEAYSGTSVLAGAKVIQESKMMREYRWAFGLEDLILGVGKGPAVLGLDWHQGMMTPMANGFIHPSGPVYGGHAILCNGVNLKGRWFRLHNSWGQAWGRQGECFLSFESMEQLLHQQGEACFPVFRMRGDL